MSYEPTAPDAPNASELATPISIEAGQVSDITELMELRLAYLTDDFGSLGEGESASLLEELAPYLRARIGRDLKVFVARDTGAGMIACSAWLLLVDKPPSPRFPHGRTGVLFNVYTRPEYRRRGLATRVMRALIAEARDLELDVVELHATDDGYPLYVSLGFADDTMTHKAMRLML